MQLLMNHLSGPCLLELLPIRNLSAVNIAKTLKPCLCSRFRKVSGKILVYILAKAADLPFRLTPSFFCDVGKLLMNTKYYLVATYGIFTFYSYSLDDLCRGSLNPAGIYQSSAHSY